MHRARRQGGNDEGILQQYVEAVSDADNEAMCVKRSRYQTPMWKEKEFPRSVLNSSMNSMSGFTV